MAKLNTDEKLKLVTEAIEEHKGENLQIIDLRERTLIADYFVVVSGTSNVHMRAIVDGVVKKFKDQRQKRPSVEGTAKARWVLLDIGDVVVHVFAPEEREFYDIESLWKQLEETRSVRVTE